MHSTGKWTLTLARMADDAPIYGFYIKAEGRVPFLASAGCADLSGHTLIVAPEYRELIKTGFTEEEVESAAKLMAAAPDLLEACEEMERLIQYVPDLTGLIKPLEIKARAAAAIAKAMGREPTSLASQLG